MEKFPLGRASPGHLSFTLEARRAIGVQEFPTSASCPCLLPGFQLHAASPPGHLGHSWGAPAVRQQQARNVPASRFIAGIWIVSSSLLAHSTYRFPSCCTGRLWEGQAVMAVLFSPPFQVSAVVGNALQVSVRAGMEAGERSGHTVRSTSCVSPLALQFK